MSAARIAVRSAALSFRAWITLVSSCPALGACDPFPSRELTLADCKTRNLHSVESCRGHDDSFQECRYYFRAIGSGDGSWCGSLAQSAQPEGATTRCDLSKAASWSRVNCASVGFAGDVDCYRCAQSAPEASRVYVQAYTRNCLRGAEQVTCNVPMDKARTELGVTTL